MDVLCTLLKRGADKDLADEALGPAAGSIGAREADLNDVIRFLLEQGANVDAGSGLMKAANMGRLSIIQTLLLGADADINATCMCTGYCSVNIANDGCSES